MKLFLWLCLIFISVDSFSFDVKRLELLRGRKSNDSEKVSWDKKFSSEKYIFGKEPAESLKSYMNFLPARPLKVLDLAMSEGRNTVYMASKGHDVTGIDISSVAIKKANTLAREKGVRFKGIVADLLKYDFNEHEFDVVLCYYFLERSLIKKIKKWVKPGGFIIFEGYTINDPVESKNNKDYLLKENELLLLFSDYQVLFYEELLHTQRSVGSIVVKKK